MFLQSKRFFLRGLFAARVFVARKFHFRAGFASAITIGGSCFSAASGYANE